MDAVRAAYRARFRKPLLVAPTGFGKTVVFSAIVKGARALGNIVWILVHRSELIDQVSDTLWNFEVNHSCISPDRERNIHAKVQVASVFSLVKCIERGMPAPNLIIIDEAHHAILGSTWGKVVDAYPKARLLGVTATPMRLSGEGLGDIFDTMVQGPSTQKLVDAGRLTPVKVFAPPTIDISGVHIKMGEFHRGELAQAVDRPKVTGDAIDHYRRLAPGRRAAVFCVSVDHARHMALAANTAGINAVAIDGKMDRGLRRDVVRDFKAGKIQWLVSCDLISEGFDCPGIEVGIALRPTQSTGLWLQQCGRILRTYPGKNLALILDHAGNALRHGLPTEERAWSLAGERRAKSGPGVVGVRVCPKCFAAQRSGRPSCADCGYVFAIESRTVGQVKGQLYELTPEKAAEARAKTQHRQRVGMAKDRDSLIAIGRMKNYKSPERWADYIIAGRKAKGSGP